jgi:hypothetical protein
MPSRDPSIDNGSRLMECVVRGELLDLAGENPVDESAMQSWDASRTVPADLIREILRGRLASTADPRGLRLRGARIAGRLDLENLTTVVGLELRDCFLPEGLVARDASLPGLTLDGCLLAHPVEPPIEADRLGVTVVSLEGAVITAHSEKGAVRLLGARVGGSLYCSSAKIRNESGAALRAEGLRVDQDVFLTDGFEAVGKGERGAVSLLGARVGGSLYCTSAKIRNESGPAIDADRLHVDQGVYLSDRFQAVGGGDFEAVRLHGAHIGGYLHLDPEGIQHRCDQRARLLLDGMTYSGIPIGLPLDGWLTLLQEATQYAAQPYQQLAAAHRAAGHDRDVRKILMEQRRHQIRTSAEASAVVSAGLRASRAYFAWALQVLAGKGERAWARLTGLTLGYGYQPWRALIGLLAVLVVAVTLCVFTDGALAQTKNSATPGAACTTVERVGVGLDVGLPLIKSGARNQCDLTSTATGQRLTIYGWGLQVLAWAFATLFIAGFTGAVRKS